MKFRLLRNHEDNKDTPSRQPRPPPLEDRPISSTYPASQKKSAISRTEAQKIAAAAAAEFLNQKKPKGEQQHINAGPSHRYGMIRTAAASTHSKLAQTPNGSNTQLCSEVQEICVVAVFLSSSAVRVLSLSCSILFLSLPRSLWFSLCFSLFSVFCMTSHSELRTYTRTSNRYNYICPRNFFKPYSLG